METSEREKHIEMLEDAKSFFEEVANNPNNKETLKTYLTIEALDYAVSSLKTDLKYDLMYEGEDVYTKADMVAMLVELKNELTDISWNIDMYDDIDLGFKCCYLNDIDKVIQHKIDKLKEGNK